MRGSPVGAPTLALALLFFVSLAGCGARGAAPLSRRAAAGPPPLLISPAMLARLLEAERPDGPDGATLLLVETSWGDESASYAGGHVPGTFHVDTDSFEPPPHWRLSSDEELEHFAGRFGFRHDDTVIVTSAEPMAAHRLAVVLRYLGVGDVRVLDGGLRAWSAAGFEVELGRHEPPTPGVGFGAPIPGRPELIDSYEELISKLARPDAFTLVDIRSWEEHTGQSSGYADWDPKGRIPGSIWGAAGTRGSLSLDHYRNPDGTMRPVEEIEALWRRLGIDTSKSLVFYCGGGWRAAEVLNYATVMGLEQVSLYSDGWRGWSGDPTHPVERGAP